MDTIRNAPGRPLVRSFLAGMAMIVLVAATLAVPAGAGDEPGQEEMMQIYMEAARPGAQHELLATGAGRWKCTLTSWADPQGEPLVSHGTETAEMVLGGRFLESQLHGEMMGMPFHGRGVMGYDNVTGKYVGTWYDNMNTGIMRYEGDYDAAKKELVCHGEFVDAVTKESMPATLVSRFVSDDRHVFEMWSPGPSGENVKWLEIVYEREE
jgi:hypothetical protein